MIKKLLFVFLCFASLTLSAQKNNSSAYSSFGIGHQLPEKTVTNSSMGGIGVSLSSLRHLNFTNPAANADLRFTTYSVAGSMNRLTIKESSKKQSSWATKLRYIALGFPIGKKAGLNIGLMPNTSVGYSISNQTKASDGSIIETTNYQGTGGTNRIYLGLGVFITKNLTVGLEGSYIFGQIDNSITSQKINTTLATRNSEIFTVRGRSLKIGVQYKFELPDKLILNTGIATKLKSDIKLYGNESLYSLSIINIARGIPIQRLTDTPISSKVKYPSEFIFGAGLGKINKWYVGAEYKVRGSFPIGRENFQRDKLYKYQSADRFSIGGFYIPRINSISSYWNRVTYRAGLRLENTGLMIDPTKTGNNFSKINDFGISFGVGLPLVSRFSSVNIFAEYGQRGTTTDNLIKENYFNFGLSLSLSDIWFKKRRID